MNTMNELFSLSRVLVVMNVSFVLLLHRVACCCVAVLVPLEGRCSPGDWFQDEACVHFTPQLAKWRCFGHAAWELEIRRKDVRLYK
jgi:hypothetical protein